MYGPNGPHIIYMFYNISKIRAMAYGFTLGKKNMIHDLSKILRDILICTDFHPDEEYHSVSRSSYECNIISMHRH